MKFNSILMIGCLFLGVINGCANSTDRINRAFAITNAPKCNSVEQPAIKPATTQIVQQPSAKIMGASQDIDVQVEKIIKENNKQNPTIDESANEITRLNAVISEQAKEIVLLQKELIDQINTNITTTKKAIQPIVPELPQVNTKEKAPSTITSADLSRIIICIWAVLCSLAAISLYFISIAFKEMLFYIIASLFSCIQTILVYNLFKDPFSMVAIVLYILIGTVILVKIKFIDSIGATNVQKPKVTSTG